MKINYFVYNLIIALKMIMIILLLFLIDAYFVGEAIKNARLKQNLTQEELGERIGVKRSQISKLESGKCSITLSTMGKVFRALGIATATLDLGVEGKVALW